MIKQAIAYAIRQNQLEGLETSQEMRQLLDRVAAGELTFDQVREIIDAKAKKYAENNSNPQALANLNYRPK